jgi:hypothetical protein
VKHKVGAQVKNKQKACTTSTMGDGGRARKKKKKTQGPTGVRSQIGGIRHSNNNNNDDTTTPPPHCDIVAQHTTRHV